MQPVETAAHPSDVVVSTAQAERNRRAVELLRSWQEEGDADEQRETGAFLIQALEDEHIVIGSILDGDRT